MLEQATACDGYALDFGAMNWCDAIVMVQPCGRSAALELGWGAGAKKFTIALLADGQEPELMLKMTDRICVSMEEVQVELSAYERSKPKGGWLVRLADKTFEKLVLSWAK